MPRVRPRLPARLAGVALGASAVIAILAGQAAQASVPATFGYRDFGYGGAQATLRHSLVRKIVRHLFLLHIHLLPLT